MNKNTNSVLVVLLMVVSFVAGYFYFKLKSLEQTRQINKVTQTKVEKKENPKFRACLESRKYEAKISQNEQEAQKAGIVSTPTLIVFDLKTGRQFAVMGAQPYEMVKINLEKFMKGENIPLPKRDSRYPKWDLRVIGKPDPNKDHWRGSEDARFVLIEYSDFECPFCKRFHSTLLQLMDSYKDKLAWVYRHLPLDMIHPMSRLEAQASECAAELGGNKGFWRFVDALFEKTKSNGRSFDKDSLESLAAELGIK